MMIMKIIIKIIIIIIALADRNTSTMTYSKRRFCELCFPNADTSMLY